MQNVAQVTARQTTTTTAGALVIRGIASLLLPLPLLQSLPLLL